MSKEQVKHGLLIGICLFAVGCATNTVTPWSSSEVYHGKGGSVRNVDGIDIWEHGAPNRPFKIIAIIERGTPMSIGVALTLWNMVTMESNLVSEAKEQGGDGIINVDDRSSFLGESSQGRPLVSIKRVVAVIKYVKEPDSLPKGE